MQHISPSLPSTPSLMTTYGRLPVSFVRGSGVYLYDNLDQPYLDLLSGIAVCNLGHAHPKIIQALTDQAQRLWHTSNLYDIEEQEKLGRLLLEVSGFERAFFANSGAEVNECALKLARLYGHQRGIERPAVIVMEGAFHGRTLATISASAGHKIQAGFEPLVEGFVRAPYGNVEALKKIAQENTSIVAVMVEPVQGEGGIILPPANYLSAVRKLCDEKNWLLILDEIQTGNGRTGNYFAFQAENIIPDILTTAKGLGNGFPIGACLAKGIAATLFKPGNHGTTFGGNPLACRVGRAVVETILEENIISNAKEMGNYFLEGLKRELSSIPGVVEIRGRGLMLGIELDHPCAHLMKDALQEQLLINVTAEKVIRLLPPLIIQPEHIDAAILKIKKLVVHSCAQHSRNSAS